MAGFCADVYIEGCGAGVIYVRSLPGGREGRWAFVLLFQWRGDSLGHGGVVGPG